MGSEQRVRVNDRDAVRVLTLNRPEKKNAIDIAMARGLREALEAADGDGAVRAVVVRGAGDGFCAGVDLSVFLGDEEPEGIAEISFIDRPLTAFSKPLIAAVHGRAVGMGVTLLPHFDLVYAAEDASFQTPFVRLGLVQEYASSFTLTRLIGRQRAAELILRARPIDAQTAEAWGLVTRVFPGTQLMSRTLEIAAEVAGNGPNAVREAKRLLRLGEELGREETDRLEREVLARCYRSEENVAAVSAFLASRRKP